MSYNSLIHLDYHIVIHNVKYYEKTFTGPSRLVAGMALSDKQALEANMKRQAVVKKR